MTDRLKVYSKVEKMLKSLLPTAPQHYTVALAMMVAGMVLGKKAQLSELSYQLPSRAKPASVAKRFHRFVTAKTIEPTHYFMPFAEQIIAHLGKKITVIMDASQVGRGCMTLMVAIVYRKRAIPLVWIVYKGKKGHTTADRHIQVLKHLKPLIPVGTELTLLGDGEYDTVDMLEWVQNETDWTYIVRTGANILVTDKGKTFSMGDIEETQNSQQGLRDVHITGKQFGSVTAIVWWEEPYEKPIYILSNCDSTNCIADVCDAYRRRYKIETIFSDQKSRGFHIHKSHLSDPDRVSRLLLASCIAYVWIVYLGAEIRDDETKRKQIDRSDRVDKSLFRLGLDWFRYALVNGIDIEVLFRPPISQDLRHVR